MAATAQVSAENPGAGVSEFFINREVNLLKFYWRVLELARDSNIPLLERFRFLIISSSILDEFFEIRVSRLKEQIALDVGLAAPDEMKPVEVFRLVSAEAHKLIDEQYRVLNEEMFPALELEGIRVRKREAFTPRQAEWVRDYFRQEVLPVLTPVGLDPAHPFPRIVNKSLNFIVSLEGKDAFGRSSRAAVVQAPRVLPRLIAFPRELGELPHEFVMLSSVIHQHVGDLFPGMKVKGCYQFRVTRNSDLWVDEEEVEDLLKALKGELLSRRFAGAVCLELADNCSKEMEEFLLRQFNLSGEDLYRVNGPVNLYRLSALHDLVDRPDLKYQSFIPALPRPLANNPCLFDAIRKGDILLHHPYQSFTPVVELLRQAAKDPDVLAIKQTVYRTGVSSPLVDALIEAARAGKEVIAVVELRARFDEEANIDLATRLQEAGAKVVYGIVGYKCHSKMCLVVRRENGVMRRYVHLGTGNYHTGTSRAYTDLGILTCDEAFGEDVHNLFQQLTGLGKVSELKKLVQSPFALHDLLMKLVEAETERAARGEPARIIAKMNSLIEPEIIRALYRASQAGVRVDLIVRGICCLRPQVPGLSDNIRVRSILGRFLEHTRIFYFLAGGQEIIYCGSADWMQRNFFRRVEVCFPVENEIIKRRVVQEGLQPYLEDNTCVWELQPNGEYIRLSPNGAPPVSAQSLLLERLAQEPASAADPPGDGMPAIPFMTPIAKLIGDMQ
ncbi:MAG: Polyphosphate kinase [candidate division BRC1 bacterium ADurb.BinA364]|nr:MAG: Polyphosphate kinase [candidate division BRC1 bacterium ADurb.BinA364]